ncbi:cilia- and flagella-associated protein 206-like isoform X2 [Argiope bruennichi]|uniref:cilia- and flagella-associated protein 206-like isoform X2 n=1 Tax=Argiope bruennichi TaxID=94029 RepID=UPI0024957D86|nr:cilia- and flagella-associated protein 206-like isoform X2 [Argiope bruennichi]
MSVNDVMLSSNPEINKKVLNLASTFSSYCRQQNERISQRTAQITVRVLLLESKWSYILQNDVSKCEKQKFIKACFSFLFDEKCISGVTVRMQCFFYGRYLSREAYKDHQKQILLRNCFHLLQKLKKVWHNASEDLRDMHNDLVRLILIKEGMEYQGDRAAFDEMRTAVNCVFPPSALSTFVTSNQKTKMAFINEVSSISAGIRLYSWYSKQTGKFMFNVRKIMEEILPKVMEDCHEEVSITKEKIEFLRNELMEKVTEDLKKDDREIYHQKLLLIGLVNYFEFIKILKENIDEVAVQTYKLDYSFTVQIKEINICSKTGPFSRGDRINPLYKELAKIWKHIQLEGHLLNFYTNLFQDVRRFAERIIATGPEDISDIPLIEDNYEQETEEKTITILPDDVKNFSEITLEFKEFCTFYCSMGILVPCNKEIGIVMYKQACYGFSNVDVMELFKRQPAKFINSAFDCILKIPQLIFTLQVEENFQFPVIMLHLSR